MNRSRRAWSKRLTGRISVGPWKVIKATRKAATKPETPVYITSRDVVSVWIYTHTGKDQKRGKVAEHLRREVRIQFTDE